MPTARALELGEPVAEILGRVEKVMASAVPFDATTSERRFVIGAPDAVTDLGDGNGIGQRQCSCASR